jgi:hypothetical protein
MIFVGVRQIHVIEPRREFLRRYYSRWKLPSGEGIDWLIQNPRITDEATEFSV